MDVSIAKTGAEKDIIYFITYEHAEFKEYVFYRFRGRDGNWVYKMQSFKLGSIYCAFLEMQDVFANLYSEVVTGNSEIDREQYKRLCKSYEFDTTDTMGGDRILQHDAAQDALQKRILLNNASIQKNHIIGQRYSQMSQPKIPLGSSARIVNDLAAEFSSLLHSVDNRPPVFSFMDPLFTKEEMAPLFHFYISDAPFLLVRNMNDTDTYCVDMKKAYGFSMKDLLHGSMLYYFWDIKKENAFFNRLFMKLCTILHCNGDIQHLEYSANDWIWKFIELNKDPRTIISPLMSFLHDLNDDKQKLIESALNCKIGEIRSELVRDGVLNLNGTYTGELNISDDFRNQHLFICSNMIELYMLSGYAFHKYKKKKTIIKECENCGTWYPATKGKEFLCSGCKVDVKRPQQQIQDRIKNNRRKFIRLIEAEVFENVMGQCDDHDACGDALFVNMSKLLAICILDQHYHDSNYKRTNEKIRRCTPNQNKKILKIMDQCNQSISAYTIDKVDTAKSYGNQAPLPDVTLPNHEFDACVTYPFNILTYAGVLSQESSSFEHSDRQLLDRFIYRFCEEGSKLALQINWESSYEKKHGENAQGCYDEFKNNVHQIFTYDHFMGESGVLTECVSPKPLRAQIVRNLNQNCSKSIVAPDINKRIPDQIYLTR